MLHLCCVPAATRLLSAVRLLSRMDTPNLVCCSCTSCTWSLLSSVTCAGVTCAPAVSATWTTGCPSFLSCAHHAMHENMLSVCQYTLCVCSCVCADSVCPRVLCAAGGLLSPSLHVFRHPRVLNAYVCGTQFTHSDTHSDLYFCLPIVSFCGVQCNVPA